MTDYTFLQLQQNEQMLLRIIMVHLESSATANIGTVRKSVEMKLELLAFAVEGGNVC